MNKSVFSESPALVVYEGANICVNFDVEESVTPVAEIAENEDGASDEPVKQFLAYSVRVAHPVTRDKVIDAIITAAYPSDVMQALINNHFLEPDPNPDHAEEFAAMQQWRAHAKEIASLVLVAMEPKVK